MAHVVYHMDSSRWEICDACNPSVASGDSCSFCGDDKPVAYWQGPTETILVCFRCAEQTLPKLAADAFTAGPGAIYRRPTTATLMQVIARAKTEFWRAVAIAYSRTDHTEACLAEEYLP